MQKNYYILFPLAFSMKVIGLWISLGIFLIGGIILPEVQQSEATDYSGSTVPTNNTSVLIEEEMEEDEINATTPSNIKIEQLANTSKQK